MPEQERHNSTVDLDLFSAVSPEYGRIGIMCGITMRDTAGHKQQYTL